MTTDSSSTGPELFSLAGRVALITGAAQGMGRATARAMARAGARVAVSDLSEEGAAQVASEIRSQGGEGLHLGCDVGKDPDLRAAVEAVHAKWGRIDILVCNAGIASHAGPLAEAADIDYQRTLDVNLRSVWKLTSLVTPGMVARRDGSIILMASLSSVRGNKALGLYSLSKAAVASLARNLAVELGPSNVRANAISPGVIQTEFARSLTERPEAATRRIALTPLRRFGTPDEIAGTVVYLASPAGAFVTGQNIVVDGGTSIGDGS